MKAASIVNEAYCVEQLKRLRKQLKPIVKSILSKGHNSFYRYINMLIEFHICKNGNRFNIKITID